MSDERKTVLVVDDEPELRELHKALLEHNNFDVITAENGNEAIKLIVERESDIDIVLSDILMPEMNGYEFCKLIREKDETKDLPLIFVSALSTLEEKVKGYSYGADDYIAKPLESEELSWKIKQLIKRRQKNRELDKQVMDSQKATMQIMNFYGDLGQILEFYKTSTGAKNYDQLTEMLFNLTGDVYNLNCTLQIHTPTGVANYCAGGMISPLESNVIEMARKRDRFLQLGSRLFISYDTFTLFVKNMPIEDEERCGTLRDSLGVLCNAIEAKIKVFMNDEIDDKKTQIAETVREVLDHTRNTFGQVESANIHAIETMIQEVEDSFFSLGLSEPQEERIKQILSECLVKTSKSFEKGKEITELFDEINDHLVEMGNIKKMH